MFVVKLNSGARFELSTGSSILESAAKANILLPYSCMTGRCSTCKCKVVSGKTRALHPESGLSEPEKADGWILGCVRTAETDVVLEVDDLGGVVLPAIKTLPCRISLLQRLASDVILARLRLPPASGFSFIPGQHINVIGPNGVRRSYSLANGSLTDNVLDLHIRAVDGGVMSDYWFNQAKVNDLLRLNGPLGTFFLRDIAGIDLIFLATGTGIAPVIAMLGGMSDRLARQRPKSVTVVWGGRLPEDLYFDVTSIPGDHKFVPVLSRAGSDWSGARGYVQQAALALYPDLSNAAVYACGSEAMIHSARELLLQKGLSASRFYCDAFVSTSTE